MKSLKFILGATLLVGTLDILSAFVDYYLRTGKGPEDVLRYIASGLFGQPAFTGGDEMIVYGMLFHYLIALVFTVIFYLLYPKIALLARHPLFAGIIYGVIIWAVMNFVVLQNSNVKQGPFDWYKSVKAMLILIVMIGLPLSFLTRNHFRKLSND